MQIILGAMGPIGMELASVLRSSGKPFRLVSRNPKPLQHNDICLAADLTKKAEALKVVEGSEVCYLTVGLDYKTKIWRVQWPLIIENIVAACTSHGCKLVFLDNVYALSKDHLHDITETTPIEPCSEKGKVRALVDRHVIEAVEKGRLKAIIARAPDFFGPYRKNSYLISAVYENLAKGKKAQWFCNANVGHSFGYTGDIAKGLELLGNSPASYDQIWNLPVDDQTLTGTEWVRLFAEVMQKSDGVQVLPAMGMKVLGLFIPILREMYEMRYQFDRPFHFNSNKFKAAFSYIPLSNTEAVRQTVKLLG